MGEGEGADAGIIGADDALGSVDEVELLVRGLRVGAFSQSALVVPLRELERGLEELRRAEAEATAADGERNVLRLSLDLD